MNKAELTQGSDTAAKAVALKAIPMTGMHGLATGYPRLNSVLVATLAFYEDPKNRQQIHPAARQLEIGEDTKGQLTCQAPTDGEHRYAEAIQALGTTSILVIEVELAAALRADNDEIARVSRTLAAAQNEENGNGTIFAAPRNRRYVALLYMSGFSTVRKVRLADSSYAQFARLVGSAANPMAVASNGKNKLLLVDATKACNAENWQLVKDFTVDQKNPATINYVSLPNRKGNVTVTFTVGTKMYKQIINPMGATSKDIEVNEATETTVLTARDDKNAYIAFEANAGYSKTTDVTIEIRSAAPANPPTATDSAAK